MKITITKQNILSLMNHHINMRTNMSINMGIKVKKIIMRIEKSRIERNGNEIKNIFKGLFL